jgi:hypothetical protein
VDIARRRAREALRASWPPARGAGAGAAVEGEPPPAEPATLRELFARAAFPVVDMARRRASEAWRAVMLLFAVCAMVNPVTFARIRFATVPGIPGTVATWWF